jgi:hypothetical protein
MIIELLGYNIKQIKILYIILVEYHHCLGLIFIQVLIQIQLISILLIVRMFLINILFRLVILLLLVYHYLEYIMD